MAGKGLVASKSHIPSPRPGGPGPVPRGTELLDAMNTGHPGGSPPGAFGYVNAGDGAQTVAVLNR